MFHGTSSGPNGERLRSILKHGLTDAKGKAWNDDKHSEEVGHRSRASYAGIYFGDTARVALASVQRARGDDKSQFPVIITALIQPRSALPDEDDYTMIVDHAYRIALQVSDSSRMDAYYYRKIHGDEHSPVDLNIVKEKFNEIIVENLERVLAVPKGQDTRKFTDPLFEAEVIRRVAGIGNSPGYDFKSHVSYPMVDDLRRLDKKDDAEIADLPEVFRVQPSYREGESLFRGALDNLMKFMRRSAIGLEEHPRFRHTLRVTEPVTYGGRNRITSVVSLPNYYTRDYKDVVIVVAHYGDPSAVIDHLASQGYENVEVRKPGEVLEEEKSAQ